MEKAYKNINYLFIAVLAAVVLGFYKTYFGLFPTFDRVTSIQHIHGLLFVVWFGFLIVQPILVWKKQLRWHRLLGKISYLLVPLILISIFFIAKEMYDSLLNQVPQNIRIARLYTPFYQILDFSILYTLAIFYKRKVSYHMRYMIATSLAISGAGVKRVFVYWMDVQGVNSFLYGFIVVDLILVGLLLYDLRNHGDYKPYLVSLALLLASQVGFYLIPSTWIWQTVCGGFVSIFY